MQLLDWAHHSYISTSFGGNIFITLVACLLLSFNGVPTARHEIESFNPRNTTTTCMQAFTPSKQALEHMYYDGSF